MIELICVCLTSIVLVSLLVLVIWAIIESFLQIFIRWVGGQFFIGQKLKQAQLDNPSHKSYKQFRKQKRKISLVTEQENK